MLKADLLALVAQQNADLVSAINQIQDPSSDPQVPALQAEISSAKVDLAKVEADLSPSA